MSRKYMTFVWTPVAYKTCNLCDGKGRLRAIPPLCPKCKGEGRVPTTWTVNGVQNEDCPGKTVVLPGQ